ncbi:MAG: EamA family transporter [Candidatus Woesearchaeota archaeon]|nr:EamA family transporter [Candidatus Woesearchaeota archaeon]
MIAVGIALTLFATLLGSTGALMLKMGSTCVTPGAIMRNYKLLLGFILYGLSTIPFLIALKFGPLSVLYPFVSLSYIWTILLSMRYLKERMNVWKWTGIALILAGVTLIGTA